MIIIDEEGDTTIRVVEDDGTIENFQVSKLVLCSHSSVFRIIFLSPNFKEGKLDTVTLNEDRVLTMKILFKVLHDDVALDDTFDVPIAESWYLTAACDKYGLNINCLYHWFREWYEWQNIQLIKPEELLFPCWRFNHAKGFKLATKTLVYGEAKHIMESNPTEVLDHHLPARVIQALNAAKGRLRTVLNKGLFVPNEQLLDASCNCKKDTLFGYESTLYGLHVLPSDTEVQKRPMVDILRDLERFDYKAPEAACEKFCKQPFNAHVRSTIARVQGYFQGLCLDCMNHSRPKTEDIDMDYWRHNDLSSIDWSERCRFSHGEPTWYFSFMGRLEARDRFLKWLRS